LTISIQDVMFFPSYLMQEMLRLFSNKFTRIRTTSGSVGNC